jgi:large subunit ribosomal protein L11
VAKRVKAIVKLQLPAGKATPAYPVGPALGQHGVAIMSFVKEYNERTAGHAGSVVPAVVTIYEDRSFDFALKSPPAADLLRQAAGIAQGSPAPGRQAAGTVTRAQLRRIAARKLPDLNARDLDQAERIIAGTARSMGIDVVE